MIDFTLSPTKRQVYRYGRALDLQLREALKLAVEPTNVRQLFPKVYNGIMILAPAGSGKTTSLQFAAAKISQEFWDAPSIKRVPLLFPLRRWLPDRTLEQALFEHVNSYVKVSKRAFRAAMRRGKFVGILDGADELLNDTYRVFGDQFAALRKRYPQVTWSVSSRSNHPVPVSDLTLVTLSTPTQEEIREIQKRLGPES